MTQAAPTTEQAIDEQPWPEHVHPPPVDLPYDDGEPLESSWHVGNGPLLKASYIAARGGVMNDYYVGVNMFVYYSWQQVRNQDYKGPDVYIVKNVDGARRRLYWAIWDEDGRYPDVIIEFLSASTHRPKPSASAPRPNASALRIYSPKWPRFKPSSNGCAAMATDSA